jgi:hypothetical protein
MARYWNDALGMPASSRNDGIAPVEAGDFRTGITSNAAGGHA